MAFFNFAPFVSKQSNKYRHLAVKIEMAQKCPNCDGTGWFFVKVEPLLHSLWRHITSGWERGKEKKEMEELKEFMSLLMWCYNCKAFLSGNSGPRHLLQNYF